VRATHCFGRSALRTHHRICVLSWSSAPLLRECPDTSAPSRAKRPSTIGSSSPRQRRRYLQRHSLPLTPHCAGSVSFLATISTHSRGDGMALHLTDKTSTSTTSAANSMLAISENVTCNGCAWKWRPRSVLQCIGVRMAASSWPTQSYTQKTWEPQPPREGGGGDI
jgi:hypothetical protein